MLNNRPSQAVLVLLSSLFSWPVLSAPKSSDVVLSQPRQSYATIKQLAKKDLVQPFEKSKLALMLHNSTDDYYDLRADFDRCDTNEFFISTSWNRYHDTSMLYVLTVLAIDVARWEKI